MYLLVVMVGFCGFCLRGVGLVMVVQVFGSSVCPSTCLFSDLYVISFCDFCKLCSLMRCRFAVWGVLVFCVDLG